MLYCRRHHQRNILGRIQPDRTSAISISLRPNAARETSATMVNLLLIIFQGIHVPATLKTMVFGDRGEVEGESEEGVGRKERWVGRPRFYLHAESDEHLIHAGRTWSKSGGLSVSALRSFGALASSTRNLILPDAPTVLTANVQRHGIVHGQGDAFEQEVSPC